MVIVVAEKHQKQFIYSSKTPFWLNLVTLLLFEEMLLLTAY